MLWNPDPIAFVVPFIQWPVRWYGISWALAFICANAVMGRIFKEEKRDENLLGVLTLYVAIGAVAGARLGHCFFYDPERYLAHPLEILKVQEGGLASHGGIVGVLLCMWLYCRKHGEDLWWLFDRMVVAASLGGVFIRIGNFMNSEIIGKASDVPWAVVFSSIDSQPRHPTQLYEALFYLFQFGLMYFLWKKKRTQVEPGFLFGLCITILFIFRFLVEFLKENQVAFESGMALNMGQWLSLPFIAVGVGLMLKRRKVSS